MGGYDLIGTDRAVAAIGKRKPDQGGNQPQRKAYQDPAQSMHLQMLLTSFGECEPHKIWNTYALR
jgi:hypothetical protein